MKPNFKGKAIYTRTFPIIVDGKFIQRTVEWEVRVMAIAENYAMVRRKGCMPFVCALAELRDL